MLRIIRASQLTVLWKLPPRLGRTEKPMRYQNLKTKNFIIKSSGSVPETLAWKKVEEKVTEGKRKRQLYSTAPLYKTWNTAILQKNKMSLHNCLFVFQCALNNLMIQVWTRLGCLCGRPRLHYGASEPAKRYSEQTPLHYPVRIMLHDYHQSFQYTF